MRRDVYEQLSHTARSSSTARSGGRHTFTAGFEPGSTFASHFNEPSPKIRLELPGSARGSDGPPTAKWPGMDTSA